MSARPKYTDSHCHIYEFAESEIKEYEENFDLIVAVADDLESSERTLELAEKFSYIVPCVGVHPWSLKDITNVEEQLKALEKLASGGRARCIGEVGLDLAFTPNTYNIQLIVFRRILEIAKDYNLPVNLHTAKAWRQALEEVVSHGIRRALFHWYTGPFDVLSEIVAHGYIISINPTVKISERHREIAKRVPLASLTFESDGPYQYRGLYLSPRMIPESVKSVAEARGMDCQELITIARENLLRFIE